MPVRWYWRDGSLACNDRETYESDEKWLEALKPVSACLEEVWRKTVNYTRWTAISGQFLLSTVWLGLDHHFCQKPQPCDCKPLIFESMLFREDGKDRESLDMRRYSTEEEATEGHRKMLRKWKRQYPVYKRKELKF